MSESAAPPVPRTLGVAVRHGIRLALESRLGLAGRARRRALFARHAREACEELGPVWVKLGQLISVRPDLFGPELVFEMERLRDRVPTSPAAAVRAVVERQLGARVEALFDEFDDEPVASASIAQVHRARLRTAYRPVVGPMLPAGTPLAIKVVRPGVEDAVLRDAAGAARVVMWLSRFSRARRYRLDGLLEEFSASLRSECDLRVEGRVADRFAFGNAHDPLVVVPRVVWPLTSRSVLAMEYVDGWRLSELDDAVRSGIDARALAVHGADVFMRAVLVDGSFHADLHPANIFVTPDGRICYLDFGIVGTTAPEERHAIAQVLAATVFGDAERALRYSAELGLVVPPEAEERVRAAVDALMRETLRVPPRDVSGFARGFLRILAEERIGIPVGYGLLVKALVTVEGVSRALYPDIDITETARPFATRLIAGRLLEPARLAESAPRAVRAGLRELTR